MSLDKLQESPSLEMINLVFEMKTKGKEVISLAPGDPSFDTPEGDSRGGAQVACSRVGPTTSTPTGRST